MLSISKAPCRVGPSASRRSNIVRVVCATDTKAAGSGKKATVGFKYDAANMRWIRSKREVDMDTVVIQPKSGPAYTVWPVQHSLLSEKGLKSVSPAEALKMQSKGWTIVDVRIDGDFEALHADGSVIMPMPQFVQSGGSNSCLTRNLNPAGAVNIPMFRFVQGDTFWDRVKKIAMAGFMMKATERDPDYAGTVASTLKKNQKVILMCAIGGTLDTRLTHLRPDKYPNGIDDPERSFGRESRCLKAAYELLQDDSWKPSNVVFVDGGFQQWKAQGLPTDWTGEDEDEE